MEGQLLPRAELAPAYGKAIWLYLYRDFSGSPADKAAERTCLRLGLTSYPQHHLVHPETLERMADTGRVLDGFLAAMDRTKVKPAENLAAAQRLKEADARAASLEASGSLDEARKAIADADPLVRIRALEILVAKDPGAVVPRAEALLATPNDPLRFLACEALKKAAKSAAAKALAETVRDPKGSLNPNVLRMKCVEALGTCGDAASVEVIGRYAASGEYLNGLTNVSVFALVLIARRHPEARGPARDVLSAGYPEPSKDPSRGTACLALARTVHKALEDITGKKVPFPAEYDAAARERLAKAWR
jgi:hypothetical protein